MPLEYERKSDIKNAEPESNIYVIWVLEIFWDR